MEDALITILAKWFFTATAFLNPGTDAQWPGMLAERNDGVQEVLMTSVVSGTPCPAPGCTPVRLRWFCMPPGVYSLVARVGLAPLEDAEDFTGSLWLRGGGTGPESGSLLIMDLKPRPGAWTNDGAAHVFVASAPGMACYQLLYNASSRVAINPDRRVTYLAIHRIAE